MAENKPAQPGGTLAAAARQCFPLAVYKSNYGFFIGTRDQDGAPFSRESEEYWAHAEDAEIALREHRWTQRLAP